MPIFDNLRKLVCCAAPAAGRGSGNGAVNATGAGTRCSRTRRDGATVPGLCRKRSQEILGGNGERRQPGQTGPGGDPGRGHADPVRGAAQEVGPGRPWSMVSSGRRMPCNCVPVEKGWIKASVHSRSEASVPIMSKPWYNWRTTQTGWPGRSRCRATRRRSIPPFTIR